MKEWRDFLRGLPTRTFATEIDFLAGVVPTFASLLGYGDEELIFEPMVGRLSWVRADAALAPGRGEPPWVIIETKNLRPTITLRQQWFSEVLDYYSVAQPPFVVLLSPSVLIVHSAEQINIYDLDTLIDEHADEIFYTLCAAAVRRPSAAGPRTEWPTEPSDMFSCPPEYPTLLTKVRAAGTPEDKGRALEDLVATLFAALPFAQVKRRNLRTSSSEIDLVIQNAGATRRTWFDDFGTYALVECRNWMSPVGAKHVRDFLMKLEKTRTKLGFLFARNGVTGQSDGSDALREIASAFDAHGIVLAVMSEEHLQGIREGANFYALIDEAVERVRFDL